MKRNTTKMLIKRALVPVALVFPLLLYAYDVKDKDDLQPTDSLLHDTVRVATFSKAADSSGLAGGIRHIRSRDDAREQDAEL